MYSPDAMMEEDAPESAVILVDQDLLLYKNTGPSAAPADSVAAQIYQWSDVAGSSYPQEVYNS